MANRPAVRALLVERSIEIPADTWFVGAEHNTCDERITFYDRGDLPEEAERALRELQRDLDRACALSAQERCRRFASAPRDPAPDRALRHVAVSYTHLRFKIDAVFLFVAPASISLTSKIN